jgi:hypothetical protein
VNDFDPQAPFIGSDGVEYACLADKLIDKPRESYFNHQIERYRSELIDGEPCYAAREAWFRRKYVAFRASSSYHDEEAEGVEQFTGGNRPFTNFGSIAGRFLTWVDGPNDPTPIEPDGTGFGTADNLPF